MVERQREGLIVRVLLMPGIARFSEGSPLS